MGTAQHRQPDMQLHMAFLKETEFKQRAISVTCHKNICTF